MTETPSFDSFDNNDFSDFEFSSNPDPRVAVSLVLDASSSMAEPFPGETRTPMDALNAGLDVLVTELNKDPLAKRRVEISVVSYGTEVTPATPFTTLDRLVLPTLVPSGITSTGKAIETALDSIEARKKEYKSNGIQTFAPWVIIITDGLATDDTTEAERRVKELEARKGVSFFAVAVEGADMEALGKFSDKRAPLKLKGINFSELFVWLSASMSSVSASNPGDGVALPSPAGWANLEV